MGKGAAIKSAQKYIRGDYIGIQDADLEYNPKDLIKIYKFIKKNKFDVLLAVPVLIKYIKIAYAPKDTIIICHPIDKMNLLSKFINGTSNTKETIIKKSVAAIA